MIFRNAKTAWTRSLRRAVVLASSLLGFACEEASDAEVFEGERFVLVSELGRPLCEGDIRFIDERIALTESIFEVDAQEPYEIFLFPLPPEDCRYDGCFQNGQIKTLWYAISHEIVHAVANHVGTASSFWKEGIAVALDKDSVRRGGVSVLSSLDDEVPELSYDTAGHFVRWLRAEYGDAGLRRLHQAEPFEDIYGVSIEDAAARYEEEAPWAYPPDTTCSDVPLERAPDGSVDASVEIHCASPDVSIFTGQLPFGPVEHRALWIEEGGTFRAEMQGEGRVGIYACQTDILWDMPEEGFSGDVESEAEPLFKTTYIDPGEILELRLERGLHRVNFVAQEDGNTIQLLLTPI